jgi:hypothetical protein
MAWCEKNIFIDQKSSNKKGTKNVAFSIILMAHFILSIILHEADQLNNKTNGYPKFLDAIKLRTCRSQRWFYMYIALSIIFSSIFLFSSENKITYTAVFKFSIAFGSLQVVMWWVFFRRVIKQRKAEFKK